MFIHHGKGFRLHPGNTISPIPPIYETAQLAALACPGVRRVYEVVGDSDPLVPDHASVKVVRVVYMNGETGQPLPRLRFVAGVFNYRGLGAGDYWNTDGEVESLSPAEASQKAEAENVPFVRLDMLRASSGFTPSWADYLIHRQAVAYKAHRAAGLDEHAAKARVMDEEGRAV